MAEDGWITLIVNGPMHEVRMVEALVKRALLE